MSQIEVKDEREMDVIFIHSKLDDMKLTPNEFRAYAHLARRTNKMTKCSWSCVRTMSETCMMSQDAMRYALKCLDLFKMVRRVERDGRSTLYILTKPETWKIVKRPDNLRTTRKRIAKDPLGIAEGYPLGNP